MAAQKSRKQKLDEIEFLEKRVEEEEAKKDSLMKQHEKLESNKENLLTGFNNLMRELRKNRNKTVKCSEHENFSESCLTSKTCRMTFSSVSHSILYDPLQIKTS